MKKKILRAIHVGFAKTGTTTYQNHLFAKHSQIHYLGKPFDDFLQKEIMALVTRETTLYDSSELKKYLQSEFDKADELESKGKKAIVLSDEILTSRGKARDRGIVAQRLKDIFYPCKIVFTIRNQFSTLKSAYLSNDRMLIYAPKKYRGLTVGFEEWLQLSWDMYNDLERGYLYQVDYWQVVDHYVRLFGKENVAVFLLEEFVRNQEEYIHRLSTFLDIDSGEALSLVKNKHDNIKISQAQLNYESLCSRLFPLSKVPGISSILYAHYKLRKKLGKGKRADVSIPEAWQSRLAGIYRQGNCKLMEEFDLPLETYHYPL